jgi:hypothetical protein
MQFKLDLRIMRVLRHPLAQCPLRSRLCGNLDIRGVRRQHGCQLPFDALFGQKAGRIIKIYFQSLKHWFCQVQRPRMGHSPLDTARRLGVRYSRRRQRIVGG